MRTSLKRKVNLPLEGLLKGSFVEDGLAQPIPLRAASNADGIAVIAAPVAMGYRRTFPRIADRRRRSTQRYKMQPLQSHQAGLRKSLRCLL